ncbi:MAG: hypothetical protein WC087_03445 [Candidatus Paceibacterota bacterium]
MKTTLSSISFYPVKGLTLKNDLVTKVLGSADWRFQNEGSFWKGEFYVPGYPLLIPNNDIEIEVLDNEVFVIRDSTGKVTLRGVLSHVDKPEMGTAYMFQSAQAVVFWPNEQNPIGEGVQSDHSLTGCVTVVWKFKE